MPLLPSIGAAKRVGRGLPDHTDELARETDSVALVRVNDVAAQVRPANVGRLHSEHEYDALANEQDAVWNAATEHTARRFRMQARGRDAAADGTAFMVQQHEQAVRAAHEDYQHAARTLQPYTRREPGAKLRYWIGWIILILGDAGGVLSAAIVLGEVPWVAAGQALSAGLAAACAGLVGAELKHLQLARARQRDPDSLSKDEARYRRFFTGGRAGVGIVVLVAGLSLLVVVLMAAAIFTLRTSVEGSASGIAFGLFAAVTALGSWLLGYASADEVADLLATMATRVHQAERRYQTLANMPVLRQRAEADEAARSLDVEGQQRGQAAHHRVDALSWRLQRNNPGVVGHGLPTGEPTGIIGRRSRSGGRP